MRYMMFIKHTEDYRNEDVPPGLYEDMALTRNEFRISASAPHFSASWL